MEELLSDKFEDEFESQIIYRGKDYYKKGLVKNCIKTPDGYTAKVIGNSEYNVKIRIDGDDIEMLCDCPYYTNCKHEYATLLAIDNKKYKELNLLPEIVSSNYSLDEFIQTIPEDELKDFLVNIIKDEFDEIEDELKDTFLKYLPKERPEYFYNKIFNLCLIEEDLPMYLINDYIEQIKEYIDCKDYAYAFTIYSSIICAMCDSKINVSSTKLIDLYSKLGIFARITYRKGNEELKNTINNWISSFKEKDFYNDVYLEDFLLNIK